ncbi:MAG: hypothetical protein J1D87_01150 [Lachnospiraceae bacterium]|nr:hypothetical protein [Lachnospiraceae bacterium]
MFFDKKTEDKLQKGSVLVGYDLNNGFSQISCMVYGDENAEIETVATVMGTKHYNIPMALCKPKGSSKWLYGKDAINSADEDESFLVTDLMELARNGETVTIEEENFDPVALLALFIKRSLSLMSFITTPENIGAIMFTVDKLDDRMVEILAKATANLNLKTKHIYFQSHTESFYYYMLHQPEELWNYQVLACEHDGKQLKTYRMERNKKTTPIVVLIEEQIFDTVPLPKDEEEDEVKEGLYKLADEKFMDILKEQCDERIVSCAYLLGDGFRNDWAKESLRFLCRNRRAFQGNNLFSKGACLAMLDKLEPSDVCKEHIFLGADKLKSNVGMTVLRRGKESYYALLDAGENWYEVHKECEFLLRGEENSISFLITPLTGKRAEIQEIVLEGAPVREGAFARYEMEISMSSVDCIEAKITDLGFGELFPAAGKVWRKQFAC